MKTSSIFDDDKAFEQWAYEEAARLEAMDDPPGPEDPRTSPKYDPRVKLYQQRYALAELEKEIEASVQECRDHGLSWHKIGMALGITGEAARQHFGKKKSA
ncbi:hypothetical protein [Bifidobacterium simiarum]|uniref:hypothetical protein n=1 Tax=Bifidobacterium simiarum TaxID=2045441 RepID=UPI001BDBFAE4|nr:hypothetical protein [Bifidobacterium simiarum]MBT1165616.1 hypothetical protein [Bifidobacterium simiarum]